MLLKPEEIIISTLDSQIDLEHEGLKEDIWINEDEIPNNGIDDDRNGYIDDINGWNFIGADSPHSYTNFEYTRILRQYKNYKIDTTDINYIKALKTDSLYRNLYSKYLKSYTFKFKYYDIIEDSIKKYFPKNNYTYSKLDSLYQLKKTNDKKFWERRDNNDLNLDDLIFYKMIMLESNQTKESLFKSKNHFDSLFIKSFNINYEERRKIGDTINTLKFKNYGNNKLNVNENLLRHNTSTSGSIVFLKKNINNIDSLNLKIKIMPLNISAYGDEHDKDITLAIRYAVDNGAKIINMSFGKDFSMHKEWVIEAMKYAEKNNVLLIHGSGNNGRNIDENLFYPNDTYDENGLEQINNFINVGSVSKHVDSTFVSSFSNYGKINLDIFAPGEDIYTTKPGNEYGYDSGTSMSAPMVSGVAALIWSYFPNLTAVELKQIILDSSTQYPDLQVIKPGTKELVPFSSLSKSGGVLNAYNAYKMAEEMSKNKKKQKRK